MAYEIGEMENPQIPKTDPKLGAIQISKWWHDFVDSRGEIGERGQSSRMVAREEPNQDGICKPW